MAIPDTSDLKHQLRSEMRRILLDGSMDSKPICDALHRWLASHPSLQTIAAFSALPDEVDLSELVAQHPERRWVYPKVDGANLNFHAVKNPEHDLAPGAFGILEPAAALDLVGVDQIDAFLCPGLAFDPRGGRLGRGRGFYDRMLSMARPDAVKIGVCFPRQLVPDTYREAHDILMDTVVSGEL